VIDEGNQLYQGRLKFFDENKNYGFIIMDEDGSDIFVHFDDLHKAGITKEFLKGARSGHIIRLQFKCMKYIGKYDRSRKATDI
jgi:cold shock CspA family protein